ncbi:DMT family transporter [Mycobacterium sp. SMC-4]|uniref:DMT family transporter n=1 Tax=Mycobacterium sp. SMC-4 TaxID=2857059 RepID=UPI003D062FEE
MAKADIAVLLALAAALFVAVGDVLHQRSAQQVTDEPVGHVALFAHLLRDRGWWLGSAVAAGGFGLQAAALGFGSVLLVQALLVTSLLFALPIHARLADRRVSGREWVWAALLAAAVIIVVTVGNPTAGQTRASLAAWLEVTAVLGPVLALCLIGARIWSGTISAVLLAVAAGALWGVFAVLTKTVVHRLDVTSWDGVVTLLASPELYAWVFVAVGGTVLQQAAFRAGALTASLPAMTIAEPIVACGLGVVVLGETLQPGEAGWFTLLAAVVVMVVATTALARGEAATHEPV